MKKIFILIILINYCSYYFSNNDYPPSLKIDSSYNYIQFYSPEIARKFLAYFSNTENDKLVIFHFGASHIQGELLTSYTRNRLQNDYGDGGLGMIFNYAAANSFSSKNYSTTKKGEWKNAKNYQTLPKLSLGIIGMSIETSDNNAELSFSLKKEIPKDDYKILIFFENKNSSGFNVLINNKTHSFSKEELNNLQENFIEINYFGNINEISLKIASLPGNDSYFRFYGINIEKSENKGLVYHSLGVASASMQSIMNINRFEEEAKILKPDIIIIDYGTNDIINNNLDTDKMTSTINEIINKLRSVNPEIIIILTSTQDIFNKGRYNSVAPKFRDLIDSIAKAENLMFWNWYDLSGGLHSIRDWYNEKYAQKDCIHLSHKGYELKGNLLYSSIINTIKEIKNNSELQEISINNKNYDNIIEEFKEDFQEHIIYVVQSGDTLYRIAQKFNTSVARIKQINNIRNDLINIGQIIII